MPQNNKFVYLFIALVLLALGSSFLTVFQVWFKSNSTNKAINNLTVESNYQLPKHILFFGKTTNKSPEPQVFQASKSIKNNFQSRNIKTFNDTKPQAIQNIDTPIEPIFDVQNDDDKINVIVYDERITLEFTKGFSSKQNVRKTLINLFLSTKSVDDTLLLGTLKVDYSKKPYYYNRIMDEKHNAIKYPKQAYEYANYIIENNSVTIIELERELLLVNIPLTDNGLKGKARKYLNSVAKYSKEFEIDKSLIYAIMEVESSFNPKAVSHSNALGLMQVKAKAAGRDVYKLIDGRDFSTPSRKELLNSTSNIRIGTAYLSLLHYEYFDRVKNKSIRDMLVISAYNGGIKSVLALFGKTINKSVRRINSLKAPQIYQTLRKKHRSSETRRYLDKVLKAKTKYDKIFMTSNA